MTICIAAIYRHVYVFDEATKTIKEQGPAIVTASDRMYSDEKLGIEYEPFAYKWSRIAKKILILIADSITVHSELITRLRPSVDSNPNISVKEVAERYGLLLQGLKAERAEKFALSPYRLSTDEFISKQRNMYENVVTHLTNQMQEEEERTKAEALIVGVDDNGAHIYYMDSHGIVHCYNDVGFASIGTGNNHANYQFMSRAYTNTRGYYDALLMAYIAKKSAEIAPSVGPATDMTQITRDDAYTIHDETMKDLEIEYRKYSKSVRNLERRALQNFIKADAENIEESKRKGASNAPGSGQANPSGS